MPELPQNIWLILLGLACFSCVLLYLREYNLRRTLQKDGDKILQKFKEKGLETFHQSIQKSQNIIGEAELEAVKVVADTKFEASKIEQQYSAKLTQLLNNSQQTISESQAKLIQFMADLQKRAEQFEVASQEMTKQRVNQLFEGLEQKISDFLINTEQKTTSSIELELKSARELIEAYKNQQFKVIDENIIALMEQTLNIVLAKKLSLKDHVELVYEALEKAKAEKFIA